MSDYDRYLLELEEEARRGKSDGETSADSGQ